MAQKSNHFRLCCFLLSGLICLSGCDQKANDGLTEATSYAIDKPYYSGPLRVRVQVSDEQTVLSDLLTLELSSETEPDYDVQFPDIAESLKEFRIHDQKDVSKALSENNKIVKIHQYRLEPLKLGMSEIPALTFIYKSKQTGSPETTEQSLTTEPVWVEVTTSLPADPTADPNAFMIADIDDVVEVKIDYTWLWIGLAVGCLLAIGIAVGMGVKPKKAVVIRRIYKSAHEIAFEVLKAISRENLVEQGRVKEFYEKLSTCLRQYIENRFQLRAPEQTTEEFLEQIKTSDALKLEHKQELQKFLEHCDLVKFARYQPSTEQINESLTIAEGFVEKTKSDEHLVEVTTPQQARKEVAS